jgi:hypothetical protein
MLAGVAVLLLAAGCSDSSTPTTPTPPPLTLTGTWTGPVTFEGIDARMTWTLTQNGTAVTGPVLLSLQSGTVLLNGFLTGTLTGTSLDYTITVATGGIPNKPSCAGQFKGTMAATPNTLTGPMGLVSTNCEVQITTNTITMTKQ